MGSEFKNVTLWGREQSAPAIPEARFEVLKFYDRTARKLHRPNCRHDIDVGLPQLMAATISYIDTQREGVRQ